MEICKDYGTTKCTDPHCNGTYRDCPSYTAKKFIINANGAKREPKKGKGRFDLIPYCALKQLALHYEKGAEVHGYRNWENGLDMNQCFSSAINHLLIANEMHYTDDVEGKNGEDLLYHLSAAVFNIFAVIKDEVE